MTTPATPVLDTAGTVYPEFATIAGLRIRYAHSPRAGADTVLLLSPWPESLLAFRPIWDTLAAEFALLAIDLPGFGLSEGRPELMSPRTMGQFLIELNAHFGLTQPHAIAPDVASPSVLFAEALQPGTFRSLFIGSGACSFPLIVDGVLKQIIEAESLDMFRALDTDAIVLNSLSEIKAYYTLPDAIVADYLAAAADGRFVEAMNFVRAYKTDLPALAPQLPALHTPVHIVSGRHDPNVPVADAEALHRQLPNSTLTVLDCGHYTWEEEADTYARLALNWLRGGYQHRPYTAATETVIAIKHQAIKLQRRFEDVTAALESLLGRIDEASLALAATNPAQAEQQLARLGGYENLILFQIQDHGTLLRLRGAAHKAKQYVLGNPLIALQMTQHDLRAALYAPLRLLVYETTDQQVWAEYDLPSSLFGQFQNEAVTTVALGLDEKLRRLLHRADTPTDEQ
ncbi:alpha/beta fold hydrolase [Hymenobacter fodinae]|uniref:DUF302 domain-containing protein n=1 Tax=Hymenobacter fodinae TaxID=2510796 RepID=A0A4Z0P0A2_9BACT|nr:alpha/beta fold hydrolase [Hymenobacter fodinae]TGE03813.1 DUF302 domain-containing protein [Hymenobacter fodinae]